MTGKRKGKLAKEGVSMESAIPDEALKPRKKLIEWENGKPRHIKGAGRVNVYPPGQMDPHEARFLENQYVKGMTVVDAARDAGLSTSDKDTTLARVGYAVAKKYRDSNSEFLRELGACGVSIRSVAEQIAEGLKSTTFIKMRDGKDTDKLVEVPDRFARHRFVETAVDIYGAKAPKKVEVEQLTFEQRLMRLTIEDNRSDG